MVVDMCPRLLNGGEVCDASSPVGLLLPHLVISWKQTHDNLLHCT